MDSAVWPQLRQTSTRRMPRTTEEGLHPERQGFHSMVDKVYPSSRYPMVRENPIESNERRTVTDHPPRFSTTWLLFLNLMMNTHILRDLFVS